MESKSRFKFTFNNKLIKIKHLKEAFIFHMHITFQIDTYMLLLV